jgi:hypothetical protein
MAVRVLFLAGMGRSGTTLVERVLAGMPEVVALGEVMHLWRRGLADNELCGCGVPFSECPFWRSVGQSAFGGWGTVDVERLERLRHAVDHVRHVPFLLARRGSRFEDARRAYAQHYVSLYRAVHEVTGAQLLIDSSKQASLPHVLAGEPGIDLRVLHCVRDARAVCHAWTKEVQRPEATDSPSMMPRYSPPVMASMWMLHNVGTELVSRHKTPVLRLRYEDFLAEPLETVRRVAAFAGVSVDDESLRHLTTHDVVLATDHTAAGNPMRFVTGRVHLRRDDAWRTHMPAPSRRFVSAFTSPLLRRYGYQVAAGSA